jgi:hypothetical protein
MLEGHFNPLIVGEKCGFAKDESLKDLISRESAYRVCFCAGVRYNYQEWPKADE